MHAMDATLSSRPAGPRSKATRATSPTTVHFSSDIAAALAVNMASRAANTASCPL